jgi:hypothetical protein
MAAETFGEFTFVANGLLLTQEDTILSTQQAQFVTDRVTQTQNVTIWVDPLAQSFVIAQAGGAFISGIDIFFRTKDTNNIPVTLQIRNMINGSPGQLILPFSEISLSPDEVEVSEDGTVPTRFQFSSPVYLEDGTEYCFVLLANSIEYNVWVARIGEDNVETGQRITQQPYAGVLFKSQNASTWTPDQESTCKFVMYRCVFQTNTVGLATFQNEDLPPRTLASDPITTSVGSSVVRVTHVNHNMPSGSIVTLSGFVGSQNGIPAAEMNANHVISNVLTDSYEINVATEATVNGSTGGNNVVASQNRRIDLLSPNIQELTLGNTNITWGARYTSTDYVIDPTFVGVEVNENNTFTAPRMIASPINETQSLGGQKSIVMRASLFTTSDNVSPVIDLDRTSLITVANRVNNDNTGETDPSGGAADAKYIIRRITLDQPAIDLRVIFAAARTAEASIDVYYKVLRSDDNATSFADLPYAPMQLVEQIAPSANESDFREYTYTVPVAPLPFFQTFAIKIVMRSTNSARVPVIRDFRAIALGT